MHLDAAVSIIPSALLRVESRLGVTPAVPNVLQGESLAFWIPGKKHRHICLDLMRLLLLHCMTNIGRLLSVLL